MESWDELINNSTVSSIVDGKKNLVYVDTETTLASILDVLEQNHILSAPVIDSHKQVFLGFLDVLDICGFILHSWNEHSMSLTSENWRERDYSRHEFFATKAKEILSKQNNKIHLLIADFSQVDKAYAIRTSSSIAELLRLFTDSKGFSRIHRVAVVDEEGRVVNVVSQSDVIRFLHANIHLLPKRAVRTVEELGLVHPIVMSRLDRPFYEVFKCCSTTE
jgi:CBS-domain-containing membrane protein